MPAPGPGVCTVCCGPVAGSHALCFACRTVAARLGVPLSPALPVRLCPLPGRLYVVLMGYKESPVDEARRRFAPIVSGLLASFLAGHGACVGAAAGGPVDRVLAVPSTARPGGPPLAALAGLDDAVRAAFGGIVFEPGLLRRAAGTSVGHMRPDARAFVPAPGQGGTLRGARALLLDDTYVSGARAQSAAAALRRAGAHGVVIVPVGRVLRPDRSAVSAAFLRAHRVRPDERDPDDACGGTKCARCVRAQATASTE